MILFGQRTAPELEMPEMRDGTGGEEMMTGGIIVMAVMMGAMFLFGGHGKKHKHNAHASPEIAVSTQAAAATAPAQAEAEKDAEHAH